MATPAYAWILGDQLVADPPALAHARARYGEARVLMIESRERLRRLPYQRRKLVLLLSAMRHYAQALRAQGVEVAYVQADSYAEALDRLGDAPVVTVAASGRGCRSLQVRRGLEVLPNTQFLSEVAPPYPDADPDRRYTLEFFYRKMRKAFALLLDPQGEPVGGRWNYDEENRKPLPRGLRIPPPPSFAPDEVTEQVMREVAEMPGHGSVGGFDLAVTHADARAAFDDFVRHRLPLFGPYEDAMSSEDAVLFHSVLSPYLNLGLLEPLALARAAEQAYREGRVPLSSAEGFVRQVVGWREYIWWMYWRAGDRLPSMNHWEATRPLPAWFWTGDTRMRCLQHVIRRAVDAGWTHHIERLMIVSSFCVLAGILPKEVNAWFLTLFIDAYEWVMVPNVFGMGLNADGGLTATKPYISAAAYINRMSDFCKGCTYDARRRLDDDACPYNALYWSFLLTHEKALNANVRMKPMLRGLARMTSEDRAAVGTKAASLLASLERL